MDADPFPSDGAPIQIGSTTRIWDKIDRIEERVNQIAEDVAFMRGQSETKETNSQNIFTSKQGLGFIGANAVISALFAILRLGN